MGRNAVRVGQAAPATLTSLLVLHHRVVPAMCDEKRSGHAAPSLLDQPVLLPARTRLNHRLKPRRVPQKSFEQLPHSVACLPSPTPNCTKMHSLPGQEGSTSPNSFVFMRKKTFLIFCNIFRNIFYVISSMFVYIGLWLFRVQYRLRAYRLIRASSKKSLTMKHSVLYNITYA